jgi:polyketide synthase-associated protein
MKVTTLQRPRRGEKAVDVKSGDAEDLGSSIGFCLQTKGFCLIGDSCEEAVLQQARAEVETLEEQERLNTPNSLVQNGLLGLTGSAKIIELELTDLDTGANNDGEALGTLDRTMWSLVKSFAPYQGACGLECSSRSNAVVHQTGECFFDDVEISDLDAHKWSSIFIRQKVLALIFLGPGEGTLELAPYDDDAIPTEINTYPGLAVLLRTDQLTFSYHSNEATLVLTSSFLQDNIPRMHANIRQAHMTPAAKALEEYISERLMELKGAETEDTVYGEEIPRSFILAMNRQYCTTAMTSVPSVGIKFPTTWNCSEFFCGVNLSGCDIVQQVPFNRWDHSTIYDEAENASELQPPKTNCQHASFCDGIELFDAKAFGLSPQEVKAMDPCQRLVLECSYEALYTGGIPKKKMINSSCGVYVGTATTEWGYMDKGIDVGTFGATGSAASITAGRISFTLGLKGACLSIDTEAASSMTATLYACESVQQKGRGRLQEFSLGIGVGLNMSKIWWPAWTAAGFLNPDGRCFTFDESAKGFVRSEGAGSIMVRLHNQKIDDEEVTMEDDDFLGILAGGWSNHNGRSASFSAPDSVAIQEVLAESARKVCIQPYDVDACEVYGAGTLLADAVEAGVTKKALRNGNDTEALFVTASKTQTGNGIEMSGIYQIIKALYSTKYGVSVPNLHLRQLNPHLEFEEHSHILSDERLPFRMDTSFQCLFARGFGGTNVNLLSFGRIDDSLRPPPQAAPEDERPRLVYWPAGGGMLDLESRPRRGYFISGSWNAWASDQRMEEEGFGTYGFTITLDEKRWEHFNIIIDGDSRKVLHPGRYKAQKGTMVFGPDDLGDSSRSSTWLIDGRRWRQPSEQNKIADASSTEAITKEEVAPTREEDKAGTQYRIRIHVSGKFQTVSWCRSGYDSGKRTSARYHVLPNRNDWSMEDAIEFQEQSPGLFHALVPQPEEEMHFFIIRNQDMGEIIYPERPMSSSRSCQVRGPDDCPDYETYFVLSRHDGSREKGIVIELRIHDGQSPAVSWREA